MKTARLYEGLLSLFDTKIKELDALRGLHDLVTITLKRLTGEADTETAAALIAIAKNLPAGLYGNADLRGEIAREAGRVATFVRGQLVVALAALIEDSIAESMRLVMRAFPERLQSKGRNIDLQQALWLKTVLDQAIDFEIYSIVHGKPNSFLSGIERVLSGPGLDREHWREYLELRARRDIAVHNGWRVNQRYFEKAGSDTSIRLGDLIYPTAEYTERSSLLGVNLLTSLREHCKEEFSAYTRIAAFKSMWDRSSLSRVVPFEKAWDYKPPTETSSGGLWGQDNFEWHWSHSEELIWQFFRHIFYGQKSCSLPDIEYVSQRLNRNDVEIIDEWLNYPFHL